MVRFGTNAGWIVALAGVALAQTNQIVSVASNGAPGSGYSDSVSISRSGDGRYISFSSSAGNLVTGDTNGWPDIFVRNRYDGWTERVSVSTAGIEGNDWSSNSSITPDGRFVAFDSLANNLVPANVNPYSDVFVRDRWNGTTELVSLSSNGTQGNSHSARPVITPDGRFVVFQSDSTNLIPVDMDNSTDIFVRDRWSGTTERVSVDSAGMEWPGGGIHPSISDDGRFVAFESSAHLVPDGGNGFTDIYVRDRWTGTTTLASRSSLGAAGNGFSFDPSISSDGGYVAFASGATNLVPSDGNGKEDIFLRDLAAGTTTLVSVSSSGAQGNGHCANTSVSANGFYVAFSSLADNLVPGDSNAIWDVFVREVLNHQTDLVSVTLGGTTGNQGSLLPQITNDARCVVFASFASDLVPGDANGQPDAFLYDTSGGSFSWSVCSPGVTGVIACPCSNPPSGAGRGCNNSSGTGGAYLYAYGGQYLSSDTLVLHSIDERPTATSIVLQGTSEVASGIVYGQGVRCLGGSMKRLYTKTAVGGSITAPDFAAGDPSISSRSAALGNPILAGQTRWYLVFYRDPILLGGCPSGSRYNATQTVVVPWSP